MHMQYDPSNAIQQKKKMLATIRHNEFKITLDVPDVL
jgi:hypothetical protein